MATKKVVWENGGLFSITNNVTEEALEHQVSDKSQ